MRTLESKEIFTISFLMLRLLRRNLECFRNHFTKLEKITGLQKQYDTVSTTRFRQLEKRIDRVAQEGLKKGEEDAPMLF